MSDADLPTYEEMDLEPGKVDQYPLMDFATQDPEITIYPYDLSKKIPRVFAYAKDTKGKNWLVFRRKAGIFKSVPRES